MHFSQKFGWSNQTYSIYFLTLTQSGNSIITTTCSFKIKFLKKSNYIDIFLHGTRLENRPQTAIIEFPDEQINQLYNKMISSQPSN